MKDGNPSLTLNIEKKEQQKGFCLRMEEGVRCLRGEERLYLLVGESLCRCTPDYTQALTDFFFTLEQAGGQMLLAQQDLPLFCSTILPKMEGRMAFLGDEEELRAFSPDPFVLQVYLSMPAPELVTAEPKCRYGEREISLLHSEPVEGVCRDTLREQRFLRLCQGFFPYASSDGKRLYLEGSDAMFSLLQEGIPRLSKVGEVYVSKRLKEQRVLPAPRFSVGVALRSNLLDMTLSGEGIPPGGIGGGSWPPTARPRNITG